MVKKLTDQLNNQKPDCQSCDDTGYCDYDIGEGNTRRGYCKCHLGTLRMEHDEASASQYWDWKIEEKLNS